MSKPTKSVDTQDRPPGEVERDNDALRSPEVADKHKTGVGETTAQSTARKQKAKPDK
ncbi:hypothetical protein ACIGCH_17525 [Pseudomonas helleri]|uniref:hypothetical protein n=1 Tax=Pseudomonas helleri TaxID=1608996 RepID=UPI0018860CDA|nr:hypothetical protein [Pseudomonas helleri]